jgi:hypothetical protein
MRPNYTLLGRSGPVLHCLLQQHETKQIFKHTGMGLTGWKKIMTDYRKYMMCLKLQTGHFLNFTTLSLNLATDEVTVRFTATISMFFSDSLCNKFCSPHYIVCMEESHHIFHMQHNRTLHSNCFIQHKLRYSLMMDH